MVDVFNAMPAGGQQAVFWVGAAASAAAVAGGVYFAAVPKIAAYNAAIATMGTTAQTTSRILSVMARGGAIGLAAGAVMTIGADALVKYARAAYGVDEAVKVATTTSISFADAVKGISVSADLTEGSMKRALSAIDSGDVWGSVGIDILTTRDALTELDRGLADVPLEDAVARFQRWGGELNLTKTQMSTMLNEMPSLRSAIEQHLASTGESADAQSVLNYAMEAAAPAAETNAAALEELQGVAATTTDDVNALADSIRNFGSAQFDTERATVKFYEAFDDLNAILSEGKASLDVTTEAGQATISAMLDSAQATNDYAGAVAAMGGSTEEVQGILEAGRQKIIDTRIALGDSEDAARLYADQLIATPDTIATQIQLNGIAAAKQDLDLFYNTYNGKRITLRVGTQTVGTGDPIAAARDNAMGAIWRNGVKEFASGAFLPGIYPATRGGIHRFAEAGYAESYISMDPKYRDRSVGIWQETGRRLGVGGASSAGVGFPESARSVVPAVIPVQVDGRVLAEIMVGVVDRRIAVLNRGVR